MSECKYGHKYDERTKQYLRQVLVQQSPLQPGVWLMPANTTFVELIDKKEGYAIVFNDQQDRWTYLTDNRHKTMFLRQDSTQTAQSPDDLLSPIPSQYTLIQPPDRQHIYKFKDGAWVYYFKPVQKSELYDITYNKKCQIGYGGIFIEKDGVQYKFETSQDSITMCNSTKIRLQNQPDETIINWKSWVGDVPTILILTKVQFNKIFTLGLTMVNTAFTVEGALNEEITNISDEDLANQSYITSFKEKVVEEFEKIQRVFVLNEI